MIEVQNIQKSFDAVHAVNDVSFRVESGETFGLLGPNGAGKTTTISMIVGSLKPDGGTIRIAGSDDPTQPHVRRQIGISPQSLALYERLTAIENLRFFASLYNLRGAILKERVNTALEFAQLESRSRDRVETYSGGMKRRLNLAVALLHDPKVILLDEPTVGVDPQSRNHLFDSIERLKKQGRTIVYTTHYMEEAERLCDRVAIMDHGRLLDVDSVNGLIGKHAGASIVSGEVASVPDAVSLPAEIDDGQLQFESNDPMADIAELSTSGVKFTTLNIARPNLESVFLNLTGRSLRD